MQIAIPIFPQFTALDAIGPYEVLQRLPGATVTFISDRVGEVRTDNGFLGVIADATYADIQRPDVIVIPGGIGTRVLMDSNPLTEWIRAVHPTTRFTTSVCTGSLLLGSVGLLTGLTATTHWSAYNTLEQVGAIPTPQRVIEHLEHRIITAAGVSSGIDMALRLSELLVDQVAAQAMQLMIEYDPHPPYDCGSMSKADETVINRVIEYAQTKR
jgi:putative intracellular protease/amidase